jgi:TRAP-type C4-dicarboxylate transport system permease small subunit
MQFLHRIDHVIAQAEKLLIVVLLSLMILVAFLQIVLRNFWSTGFSWGDPFVRYLVLWVGFIGAALATREGKHIKLDVLSRWLPRNINHLLQAALNLISAGICGLLTVAAFRFVRFEAQLGDTSLFMLPAWLPQVILPVACAIMALRFLLGAAVSMTTFLNPETASEDPGSP